jgi:hypothetical protein
MQREILFLCASVSLRLCVKIFRSFRQIFFFAPLPLCIFALSLFLSSLRLCLSAPLR